jgi:nucleoside phosphorylase
MRKGVPKGNADYTVAWIATLPLEMAAARMMLDETHDWLPTRCESKMQFIRGSIENHNIVVVCLGRFGDPPLDVAVAELRRYFPCIQLGLSVGIGGGIPTRNADIRLGDVVVGTSHIDLDFGRRFDGKFRAQVRRAEVDRAQSQAVDAALANVKANHKIGHRAFTRYLSSIVHGAPDRVFSHPDEEDCLFAAAYTHVSSLSSCDICDKSHTVSRVARQHAEPVVHYGRIASSNRVLKDAITRYMLAYEFADELAVFCADMEATGLTELFPSLVIRGICDYANSHKNKNWKGYAAAAAAAHTKELLLAIPRSRTMDSDQSDTESVFSTGSTLSSQSSQAQLTSIAAVELAGLLLEDSELYLLYPNTIIRAGPDRLERRLRRLIRRYGRNLQDEVLTEVHRQAARFVQGSARRTALEVRRALFEDTRQLPLDRKLGSDHTAIINAWLESQEENLDERHTQLLHSSNAEASDNDDSRILQKGLVGDGSCLYLLGR